MTVIAPRHWRMRGPHRGPGSDRAAKRTLGFAREMDRHPTGLELAVEAVLRGFDVTYGRQVVVYGYVADFYVPAAGLDLEADGPHHADQRGDDQVRDAALLRHGIVTLRIGAADARETWSSRIAIVLAGRTQMRSSRGKSRTCPTCGLACATVARVSRHQRKYHPA